MTKLNTLSAVASLRRWADINDDMGRVVDGQTALMRTLADNMEAGFRPADDLANGLDEQAEAIAAGKALDPADIAAYMKAAAAALRFGRDALLEELAVRARLGEFGEAAATSEVHDGILAIRSAGALPADSMPRPITDAPQDGSPILAVIDGKPSVIRFFEPWGNWQESSVDFSTIDLEKDDYFGIGRLVPSAWTAVPKYLLEANFEIEPEKAPAIAL